MSFRCYRSVSTPLSVRGRVKGKGKGRGGRCQSRSSWEMSMGTVIGNRLQKTRDVLTHAFCCLPVVVTNIAQNVVKTLN